LFHPFPADHASTNKKGEWTRRKSMRLAISITSMLLLVAVLAGCMEEQRYSYRHNTSDPAVDTSREGMILSAGN
jgi:hypothetical protein